MGSCSSAAAYRRISAECTKNSRPPLPHTGEDTRGRVSPESTPSVCTHARGASERPKHARRGRGAQTDSPGPRRNAAQGDEGALHEHPLVERLHHRWLRHAAAGPESWFVGRVRGHKLPQTSQSFTPPPRPAAVKESASKGTGRPPRAHSAATHAAPRRMGWRCGGCGRYGDRAGVSGALPGQAGKEANWCVRQGTASMAGVHTCCLCQRFASDFAFEAQACPNCRRQAGLPRQEEPAARVLSAGSPPPPLVRWAVPKGQRQVQQQAHCSKEGMKRAVCSRAATATRIAVFDFDGVLFRTPERPAWFPRRGTAVCKARETCKRCILGRVGGRGVNWCEGLSARSRALQITLPPSSRSILPTFRRNQP